MRQEYISLFLYFEDIIYNDFLRIHSLLLFLELQIDSCVQNSLCGITDVDPNVISSSSFRKVNMSINLLLIKTLRAIDINFITWEILLLIALSGSCLFLTYLQ